jgi:hypothetical protein
MQMQYHLNYEKTNINQVFDHVARKLVNAGIDGQGLVDDLALEDVFEFLTHDG